MFVIFLLKYGTAKPCLAVPLSKVVRPQGTAAAVPACRTGGAAHGATP